MNGSQIRNTRARLARATNVPSTRTAARTPHGVIAAPQKAATAPSAGRRECAARTRKGSPCKRQALPSGRCPNHGGLSTGPKTAAGRERIAEAQRARWARWHQERNAALGARL